MTARAPLLRSLGWALLLAVPAAAQGQQSEAELRRLIPDAATTAPQDWARAQPAAGGAPTADASATIDVAAPLADLPGMVLAWPAPQIDLPPLAALTPDLDVAPAMAEAQTQLSEAPDIAAPAARRAGQREDRTRFAAHRLVLAYPADSDFPERRAFEARYWALATLQGLNARDREAIGQVALRAASDRDLLESLLKLYGYYDGEVIQTIGAISPGQPTAAAPGPGPGGNPGGVSVRFDIVPGTRYRLGKIDTGDLATAGADYPALRQKFDLQPGDPVNSDAILAATGHLDVALGDAGYAFAKVGVAALLVDHRREEGDVDQPVTPGAKYRFGPIISGRPRFLSSNHLGDIARFKPGQLYSRSQVDDLRRAILATGLVASVTVTARDATPAEAAAQRARAVPLPAAYPEPATGLVALDVRMTKAPPRTLAGAIGYDTGEGFRLEASWEHRNLFPPEGDLRVRAIAGTDEQLAGVTFRRSNFLGRDRVLTIDLYADNAALTAYAARTVDFSTTFERINTLLFQKRFTWSMGVEAAASAELEGLPSGVTTGRTNYRTLALPLRAEFDTSDDLLDPKRGWRAALRVSPEESWERGGHSTYARIQGDASVYVPTGKTLVLAGRVRLGTIPGAPLEDIAPSRRFYAGGGGSIRGYGYELVGPRNALGQPEGARSLYEFSLEARVHTGLFGGALSLVPFLDAGGADTGTAPSFKAPQYGAGIGLRYQTGFGPIRVDVGTPLNPRPGDSRIGVYVALGQAF